MSIALIVGLGNPGPKYQMTRHNAGFWFLDQLAASFRRDAKFHGEVCRSDYWLLKPHTFMNHSGQSVAALANYYKIPVEQILVVHDDLDFPVGTVRLKQGGGDGRHNGLKSIIAHLGSKQFLRLRIGIGHPGSSHQVTHYVLGSPSRDEQIEIERAMTVAIEVLPSIVAGELNKAMQVLHSE
ncbi:MAG: aminoacyl-tRNA hydrolase [Thiomargarita sp.]|nr:aminoacyl-tRNA hydrolase [Thiomargarita sp.]